MWLRTASDKSTSVARFGPVSYVNRYAFFYEKPEIVEKHVFIATSILLLKALSDHLFSNHEPEPERVLSIPLAPAGVSNEFPKAERAVPPPWSLLPVVGLLIEAPAGCSLANRPCQSHENSDDARSLCSGLASG